MSVDGKLYLKNQNWKRVHVVDINTSTLESTFVLDCNIHITDWAFHPEDGMLYAVRYGTDAETKNLFRIDPSKASSNIADLGDTGITGTRNFGAVFFDKSGNFYITDNYSGEIFRIDISNPIVVNPRAIKFSDTIATTSNDGARCNQAHISDKPIIMIEDSQVVEGNSGSTDISFTITSGRVLSSALKIDYIFLAVTAAGSDYDDKPASVIIPAGKDSATLTLQNFIVADTIEELDETFLITLSSADALFLDDEATGTIINDDYAISLKVLKKQEKHLPSG